MALTPQAVNINFAQGLDTKTDPFQVSPGKYLTLVNSVFTKGGALSKRNGYGQLTSLPDTTSSYLTTFNGNLTALGSQSIQAYSQSSNTWVSKGKIQPLSLSTLPLIRSVTNQSYADSAVAPNGFVCTVYTDQQLSSLTTPQYKYAVADSVTGQNIVAPTVIAGCVNAPKVFILGNYFVLVFGILVSATNHLQYIAISTATPTNVTAAADISTQFTPSSTGAFDGFVTNNKLYIAWNGSDGGGAVRLTSLSNTLNQSNTVVFAGHAATLMSVTADTTQSTPVIWATFYDSASTNGYTLAVNQVLFTVLAPTQIIAGAGTLNIASAAQNSILTFLVEEANNYSYDSAIPTRYVAANTVTQAGTVGTPYVLIRSVGLASKAFIVSGTIYTLTAYQSAYQPTYFLVNVTTSTAASPVITAKVAYQNGGGYYITGLPGVTVTGTVAQIPYLYKDLITSANKDTNVPTGTQVNGIYSQTGANLATFDFATTGLDTAEIGKNLLISGGYLSMYDGYLPVEQNFFVYPDNIKVTTATGSGGLIAQTYFYQVTYEWADNQGNIFRSAPSIPVSVVTTTSSSTNTINVPYLRLTSKIPNPVKIVIYRWSTAQQVYYAVTSITQPVINSTTSDSVAFTDVLSDDQVLGNAILYTTGGVVEDVNGPASNLFTLFDTRFWLVDAEDPNLLWYSKQVIENTPVEMSDLFTLYVAPTTGAQGSTGPITAISVLDDKLILFKQNAIYYINGAGPDNTGANSQYSEPIFITSTVGCSDQNSIVFQPGGLMFESDKGIWLLGRDLQTSYIGAGVEAFNTSLVQSAVNVPETNEVRFTLSTGQTLMYDYYYGQWGTFEGVPAVSSTIYEGLHTFINKAGQVYQEKPGTYVDGTNPVLMSFTTSWMSLAGIQGYERFYYMLLLGNYLSPFKLNVQMAYDYIPSITQATVVTPDTPSPAYGLQPGPYGSGTPYGGNPTAFKARVFPTKERCETFQITVNELYDPSFGVAAGAGLTLSAMTFLVGASRQTRTQSAGRSFG